MNIIITGATGFVGRQLIPVLDSAGHTLLLAGRDMQRLQQVFPEYAACTYSDLRTRAAGHDAVIHLAARNNDQGGSEADFAEANVRLAVQIAEIARDSGVPHFIHFSSLHAMGEKSRTSLYASSKKAAELALDTVDGITVSHLRCGAVYGDELAGNLAIAKRFPGFLRRPILAVLTSLKPTTSIARVAEVTADALRHPGGYRIVTDDKARNGVYKALSTLLDWGFAIGVFLFFGWLLLILAMIVWITSPGPAVFVQDRVGKAKAVFPNLKFRTMAVGTKQAGTHEVSAASVTGIGHFLRRYKLDELPQIFNIMRGELSLVGPRACLPSQEVLVNEREQRGIYAIRPGITGYAQIRGIDMSDPVLLAKTDKEYLDLRCLILDLQIVIATFLGRGSGDRVAA